MSSALFLYSEATGTGKANRNLDEVLLRLGRKFDALDVCKTASIDEVMEKAGEACGKYDALIFSGGDGTFNHLVSALIGRENPPVLGYINGGTLCDIGKNFGISGSYKKALRIIEAGETCTFDVGEINGSYFCYVAAVGAFADIAYVTPRNYKKRLGKVAYYTASVKEAFKPTHVDCHIEADGKTYDLKVPFILCMNGRWVGGFPVNSRCASIRDGKCELYLTKPGIFNGLLHYLFFKTRTVRLSASEFSIETSYPMPWCLDGETGPVGSVKIRVIPSHLQIYCSRKHAHKGS